MSRARPPSPSRPFRTAHESPRRRQPLPDDTPRRADRDDGDHRADDATVNWYGTTVTGREVHVVDYLKVVYKRRWAAGTVYLLIVLLVALYTVSETPMFEARVQILIDKENSNVVSFKEAFEQNQSTDDYYQTQFTILRSRALARKTMDVLQLWEDGRFKPPPNTRLTAAGVVRATVARLRGWMQLPAAPGPALAGESTAQSSAIDQLLAGLTVTPVRDTRLVDVRFESADPIFSAQVANTIATAYVEQNLELKTLSSKEASDWLGERLIAQRRQLETSEQALQHYREESDSVSLEQRQDVVVQRLGELNAALTQVQTGLMQKTAAYEQMRGLQSDPAGLDTFPALFTNAFIQQQKGELVALQQKYAQLAGTLGPHHPNRLQVQAAMKVVEDKLAAEIGKVAQSMHNDLEQAEAQERSLRGALDQQKRDALALSRKGIKYGALAREVASNRQIFDGLMQRSKETGISGELRSSNIRVVDAAEPPRSPSRPNLLNNLLLALVGGATIAAGLALFVDYLDNRITTPDEIQQELGLPYLGMIPALFRKAVETPLIGDGAPHDFAECVRAVRTNLMFSSADAGPRCIVVTSTALGEGKSLVSANLAIALAQAGQRVLLLDADMRRPSQHTTFAKALAPGLADVLVGGCAPGDALHLTTVERLSVMTAGTHTPNPSELLGSQRFRDILDTMAGEFDWVLLDTPPVIPVTDASVVAHWADGVVFIVGADTIARPAAQRALDQLASARATVVGAILNRVDLRHHRYYYSQYYTRYPDRTA